METKDLWLLLVGAVLGYVINLTATFTAPSVGTAFSKLKSGFIERNKAKALAAYAEVQDFRTGKRDKYLYAINHWGFISLLTLTCFLGGIAGFVVRRARWPIASTGQEHDPAFWLLFFAMPIFFMFLIGRRTLRLALTLSRIENFEDYRAELLRRWPDIQLPDGPE